MKKLFAATLISLSLTGMAYAQGFTCAPLRPDQKEAVASYERLTSKSYKVDGTPNIESFFLALAPGINSYFDSETIKQEMQDGVYFIVDKKNGYISYFCEGDGCCKIQCCYWNTKSKQKMVAVYYDAHVCMPFELKEGVELEGDSADRGEMFNTSYLAFFLYNEETKMLESIEPPFRESLEMPKEETKAESKTESKPGENLNNSQKMPVHFICQLPQKGKNIQYYFGREEDENPVWHTLTYNGLLFEEEPQK